MWYSGNAILFHYSLTLTSTWLPWRQQEEGADHASMCKTNWIPLKTLAKNKTIHKHRIQASYEQSPARCWEACFAGSTTQNSPPQKPHGHLDALCETVGVCFVWNFNPFMSVALQIF